MATADAAILIDDDAAVEENETKISTLIEILNISREQCQSALEAAGYDLQRAIAASLDHNPSRPIVESSSRVKNAIQQSLQMSHPIRQSVSKEVVSNTEELSPQWRSCFQMSATPFVDPDFPPKRASLDGRKAPAQSNNAVVSCCCKLPATSRTVQSDGPNFGRFFLSCGKPRFNRQRGDTSSSENDKPCAFFQWDNNGTLGGYSSTRWSQISWHAFVGPQYAVYRKKMGPHQIRQGAVGNCWFLSALVVVAEKDYLVRKVFPHCMGNDKGCYQVNLCLDGKWTPVLVDAHLPVLLEDYSAAAKPRSLQKQAFRGVALQNGKAALPAFCAIPQGQLWPALVEKAYAKAHGSYSNLSGGFIAEGLADLTGAPYETILFENKENSDSRNVLWARLLSFSEAGFLMGVATNRGGEGLVGSHAYSVLKVQELHGSKVGAQQKVTDFFSGKISKKAKLDVGKGQPSGLGETIRLVRIRNPWGKKEWQGAFSTNSDTWTTRLRNELGKEAWGQNDGTFWMSYDDVLTRFHHMDVCKTREGWIHAAVDGYFDDSMDFLRSSKFMYALSPSKQTWSFLSLLQPKKRANTATRYWYSDLSMIVLKRSKANAGCDWKCETLHLHGVTRRIDVEIFLDPAFEYLILPLAGVPTAQPGTRFSFRLTAYSSHAVELQARCNDVPSHQTALCALHTKLLSCKDKVIHAVGTQSVLICVPGKRCLYFLAVNSSSNQFLSLFLTVELGDGRLLTFGKNDDTHDVAPTCQKILLVVSSTGKQTATTSLKFKYMSDTVLRSSAALSSSPSKAAIRVGFGSEMAVSELGERLTEGRSDCFSNKGGGMVDIFSWIPQLGATSV